MKISNIKIYELEIPFSKGIGNNDNSSSNFKTFTTRPNQAT